MISEANRIYDYFATIQIDDSLTEFNSQKCDEHCSLIRLNRLVNQAECKQINHQEKQVNLLGSHLLWLKIKRFDSVVINRYPLENHVYYPFPPKLNNFVFPNGVQISQEQSQQTTHSFVLTYEDGSRIYCTCLIFQEKLEQDIINQLFKQNSQLYVQKAICLISHYNYLDEHTQILKYIYRLSLSKNQLPIERFIQNIVDDIKLPEQNLDWRKQTLQFDIGTQIVNFRTCKKYPPFSSNSLLTLFRLLDLETIIYLYQCILLEKKIIFYSTCKSVITQVTEALFSLIFPFEWHFTYIPILPANLIPMLESPIPFIIGLEYIVDISNPEQDVDKDTLEIYLDNIKDYYLHQDQQLPQFPEKQINQLKRRLDCYSNICLPKQQRNEFLKQQELAFQYNLIEEGISAEIFNPFDIRDAFLELNTSFMMNYNKFVVNDKNFIKPSLNDIFKMDQFLEYHQKLDANYFLQEFVKTMSFSQFIEKRTEDSSYKLNCQFFDACMSKKRSQQVPLLFVEQKLSHIAKVQPARDSDIDITQYYSYINFPSLNPNLYIQGQTNEEREIPQRKRGLNYSSQNNQRSRLNILCC